MNHNGPWVNVERAQHERFCINERIKWVVFVYYTGALERVYAYMHAGSALIFERISDHRRLETGIKKPPRLGGSVELDLERAPVT